MPSCLCMRLRFRLPSQRRVARDAAQGKTSRVRKLELALLFFHKLHRCIKHKSLFNQNKGKVEGNIIFGSPLDVVLCYYVSRRGTHPNNARIFLALTTSFFPKEYTFNAVHALSQPTSTRALARSRSMTHSPIVSLWESTK